jgi:lipoprotein-releasing system permease protein
MRFELTVALKYLIPRWRQLSVSIISLISILVISLVVWLVVLFLSVTEGIEKKWIEELVALNAPVRMVPSDEYYRSYFYQIDSVSLDSNYTTKTIGEKLASIQSDPYDSRVDSELSYDFPPPDRTEDGRLKDPVKEGFEAIYSLPFSGVRPQEYEVTFGNLRLQVVREGLSPNELKQTFLTQVSYIASHDGENRRVNQMVLPPTADDYNNLLRSIIENSASENIDEEELISAENESSGSQEIQTFFSNLEIKELQTADGFVLTPSLFPREGRLKGIGLSRYGKIKKIVIPHSIQQLEHLENQLISFGHQTLVVDLIFEDGQMHLSSQGPIISEEGLQIILAEKIPFQAALIPASLNNPIDTHSLEFKIEGMVQQLKISGRVHYEHLAISQAVRKEFEKGTAPLWVYPCKNAGCRIPCTYTSQDASKILGEGLLIAKHFKNNGVRIGDKGYLSYFALAGSSMQEQRIPVYVAGFYDPGMMPVGNKLIFVDPSITALLRSNTSVTDPSLGNGINIWLDHLKDASQFKETLIHSLEARGIGKYWDVQSYHDYEFTRPILEQLRSDKNLFTLIAIIILIVACSNIISMLILLVNDKKREIGILQSMGASPKRIAVIFGLCGFATGLASCVIGTAAAILTLKNLQSLVNLLSFLQGRDAFQSAFYGSSLPNDLSYSSLLFVLAATLFISLLAGIVPAAKASKIRPTEILRSE